MEETTTRRRRESRAKRRARILRNRIIFGTACVCLTAGIVAGGLAAAGAAGTFLCYRRMAIGKFGGVTGDLAGYFLQMCELVMLACVVLERYI